jgi:hypothetical protein
MEPLLDSTLVATEILVFYPHPAVSLLFPTVCHCSVISLWFDLVLRTVAGVETALAQNVLCRSSLNAGFRLSVTFYARC